MRRLALLTYHSLDASGAVVSTAPDIFAAQMACLAERDCRGITLREAVAYRDAHGTWPERTVVLTFDDGYANVHAAALPILRRHGFSATLFVVTGHIGGSNDWAAPPHGLGTQPMLSWSQVSELAAAGWEIGSHTRTHPDLRRLDAAAISEEIDRSRGDIAAHLQQAVESFAYPYGSSSAPAAAVVQRAFRIACTTELRRAGRDAAFHLPRVDAYYLRSPAALPRLLDGRLDAYLTARRWMRLMRARLAPVR